MEKLEIHPIDVQGSWVVGWFRMLDAVYAYAKEYMVKLDEYNLIIKSLQEQFKDDEESVKEGAIYAYSKDSYELLIRIETSAFLFAAFAIEGFVNFYGTIRLGHPFYNSHLERFNTEVKLVMIFALCFGLHLEENDELRKIASKITNHRNNLVHPKTKPLNSDKRLKLIMKREFEEKNMHTIVNDLERFFELFFKEDPRLKSLPCFHFMNEE